MGGARAGEVVTWPFAPERLDVHPLTRITLERDGRPLIVCHIEFRDAWGDTTKATGALQVQLYRPVGGLVGGTGTQELTWDVDLSDLSMQRLFDPATRTYRLELEGAPEWVLGAEGDRRDEPRARLRAVLRTRDAAGAARELSGELSVGR